MILVVEDDADGRQTLIDILAYSGYPAAGAANGREALEYLSTHSDVELILLDLMMPIMDGFEFRALQCTDPRMAAIPIVVVSGIHDGRQHAEELGAVGFFEKPVRAGALLDCVAKILRRTGAQRQA